MVKVNYTKVPKKIQKPDIYQEEEYVEQAISKRIADAYDADKLDYIEVREISAYILREIKHVQNQQQLIEMLEELCARWDIFTPVLETERVRLAEGSKEEYIDAVRDKLLSFLQPS
jgi:hypothetical protein